MGFVGPLQGCHQLLMTVTSKAKPRQNCAIKSMETLVAAMIEGDAGDVAS